MSIFVEFEPEGRQHHFFTQFFFDDKYVINATVIHEDIY